MKIITRLREQGYTALLAGGCVRDQVLGLLPKDFDVATDAPPQVVQGLFARTQAVGEAFGVVLVHQGKISTEVATFRKEWGYHDGRRPDHVQFTDAKNDVLRRDFTITACWLTRCLKPPIMMIRPGRL
ncbi:MAG: CCA tRNA nucleotidyltransferase [Phycisphaerales bacterium]|nr:CCA tRNA nucleotidyltransferase [Phycisphaerales bacterium]